MVSLSTPFEICNSPINRSPSKMLYSFPKCERFKNFSSSNVNDVYYNMGDTKSHRFTGMGKGRKSTFIQTSKNPPPGTYNPFNPNFDTLKKSFGLARDKMPQNGPCYIKERAPGIILYIIRSRKI